MFRNRKKNNYISPIVPISEPTQEIIEKSDSIEVNFLNTDCVVNSVPNPEDYHLCKLIDAGVDLKAVPSNILDAAPSNSIEEKISSLLDSETSEKS